MIAFALIVAAAVPLIYPHIFLLRAQNQFIEKIELDHAVNLFFADLVEKMYKNEVSWDSIINGTVFEMGENDYLKIGYNPKFPFKGSFKFKDVIHKPKGAGEAPYTLYHLEVAYLFFPSRENPSTDNTLNYRYDLFVVRDLWQQKDLPPGEQEGGEEPTPPPQEQKTPPVPQ